MTAAELAALLVAATGAAAVMFPGLRNLRGDRFNRDVAASAALLTGYKDMVENLRRELDAVRRSLAEERQQRAQERRELHDELDEERRQRAQERRELYDQIDELRACVDTLMRRSPQDRTRTDDKPEGAP